MLRVNYYAEKYGFVGWECFSSRDENVMMDCIKIAQTQMSKTLDEQVNFQIIKL